MKINYIAYLDPFDYQGGGEINLRGVIENGRERGHLINITSVYKTHKVNLFPNPDFYILADIYNSPLAWRRLDEKLITKIINSERYIHFSTAYAELCHQDYLPCNGLYNGTLCPFVKGRFNFQRGIIRSIIDIRSKKFKSKNCFRSYGTQLYKNAILNVFQSPMHRKTISQLLDDGIISEYFDLKPRIDSKLFFNHNIERDINNIFVGVISEAKGWYEMKRNFSTKGNIVFIGNVARGIKVDFGNHVGYISHKEIPQWMNRAKNFVFLPRWPEPQPRVVAEAALCGCNLMLNENVGIASFNCDLSDPRHFENPEEELWKKIEAVAATTSR